jgi:hypothetical protein
VCGYGSWWKWVKLESAMSTASHWLQKKIPACPLPAESRLVQPYGPWPSTGGPCLQKDILDLEAVVRYHPDNFD